MRRERLDKSSDLGVDLQYEYYSKKMKGILNRKDFRKVSEGFWDKFTMQLVEDKDLMLWLPRGFGYIYLTSYLPKVVVDETTWEVKSSNLTVDYGATNKARRETGDPTVIIYHENDHTSQRIYRFKWKRPLKSKAFRNARQYSFYAARVFKRRLAKQIKSAYYGN